MSTQRIISQIQPQSAFYRTIVNTMWLYPEADIAAAMATTSYTYTFDGTIIICPDLTNMAGLYNDIYLQTTISQPISNQGFSLGVGTTCQNFGKTIIWQCPAGNTLIQWQLVKQITPQTIEYIPVPGNSPNNTVGYITTVNILGASPIFDGSYVVSNS